MRTHGIVDFSPVAEFAVKFIHLEGKSGDLIKLLGVGAVGAFDGAVEFGGARRQHEQVQSALLAGLFELGGELASAIDLHGANGERHAVLQSIEELSCGLSGGVGMGLDDVPARDYVAGGELFEDDAGDGTDIDGIDLNQVAGAEDPILPGFAHSVGTGTQSAGDPGTPVRGGATSRPCRFKEARIRPIMDVEMAIFCFRSRTASLSLPQGGNCNRKVKTFSDK
jgi:hypothetical protein